MLDQGVSDDGECELNCLLLAAGGPSGIFRLVSQVDRPGIARMMSLRTCLRARESTLDNQPPAYLHKWCLLTAMSYTEQGFPQGGHEQAQR